MAVNGLVNSNLKHTISAGVTYNKKGIYIFFAIVLFQPQKKHLQYKHLNVAFKRNIFFQFSATYSMEIFSMDIKVVH